MRPRTIVWAFAPYAALSALHVVLLGVDSPLAGPTKIALMPLLAIPVIVASRWIGSRETLALLLLAILFSWLGDSAGALFPAAPELPLMLGFFGMAHLVYIALFARRLGQRRMPWWSLIYVAWWIGMMIFVGPHTGALFAAVAAYGVVLGMTAALATRCHRLIMIGGAFFLASDTLLALRLFLPDSLPPWSSPAVMLTYTLGQSLIVAGALLSTRTRKAA